MADSKEQRPPKPAFFPGGYLPRLWKAEPEPVAEPVPKSKSKKKGKGKKPGATGDDKEATRKGVLLEETPALDTIEARRTARLIATCVVLLGLMIFAFVLYRVFVGGSAEDARPGEDEFVQMDLSIQKERAESEARSMIERAREVARNGNTDLAFTLLERVPVAYPETEAANDARRAVTRSGEELSAFLETLSAPAKAASKDSSKRGSLLATTSSSRKATGTSARPTVPARIDPDRTVPTPSDPPAPPATKDDSNTTITPIPPVTISQHELPAGSQARPGVEIHPSGWPLEIVGGRDGAEMVLVPGGEFVMGREGGDPAESPAHRVMVSTFYIDVHEVTIRQFARFLKEAGPRRDRDRALARDAGSANLTEDFPVTMVSAKDAQDYAEWAGKRLPTEAQWEKAARGTDHRPYPWGPLPPVWEKPREPRQIDSIMSFPLDRSPFGAYDMAGNALEWTKDWFDPHYYAIYRGVVAVDPAGPTTRPPSLQLTVRGASKQWIVSAREGIKYESRLPFLGFRCAMPVEGPDNAFLPPVATPSPAMDAPRRTVGPRKKAAVPF